MTKAPIKACTVNIGFVFKAHPGDATKTDLFSVNKLYFSKHTPYDELDAYIKTYFDTLYTQGATQYIIAYNVSNTERYITCEIPNTLISTFDVAMPMVKEETKSVIVTTIDDYDINICYNRGILQKEMHKSNGIDSIGNTFQIVLDPCKSEDVEASLIQHYQSYLLLGITELTRDEYNIQYTSNVIVKSEQTG